MNRPRLLSIGSIIFTTLPLIGYPFVVIADVMSLAGSPSDSPIGALKMFGMAGAYLFLWASLLYPLPYLICLIASIFHMVRKDDRKALKFQKVLLGYLGLLVLLFAAWCLYTLISAEYRFSA